MRHGSQSCCLRTGTTDERIVRSPFTDGCPARGAEVLEEMEFQPMFDACKRSLGGKRVALFGSYGWGDGEWMRTWESDCDSAGLNLVCESVICTETPGETALEACRALGKALVE